MPTWNNSVDVVANAIDVDDRTTTTTTSNTTGTGTDDWMYLQNLTTNLHTSMDEYDDMHNIEELIIQEEKRIEFYQTQLSVLTSEHKDVTLCSSTGNQTDNNKNSSNNETSTTSRTLELPTTQMPAWSAGDLVNQVVETSSSDNTHSTKHRIDWLLNMNLRDDTTTVDDDDSGNDRLDCDNNIYQIFRSILLYSDTTAALQAIVNKAQHKDQKPKQYQRIQPKAQSQQEKLQLSAMLRNFCFTSVQRNPNTSMNSTGMTDDTVLTTETTTPTATKTTVTNIINNTNNEYDYILNGYFTITPHVYAKIIIDPPIIIRKDMECDNKTTKTKRSNNSTCSEKSVTKTRMTCTLFYNNDYRNHPLQQKQQQKPQDHHNQEWCNWIQQQIVQTVQETCGYNCTLQKNNKNDQCISASTNKQNILHNRHTFGISSYSPYFLSAYITCIHEFLVFDQQCNTLQTTLLSSKYMNICNCSWKNKKSLLQPHNNTIRYKTESSSSVIRIPIYRSIKVQKKRRHNVIYDEEDDIDAKQQDTTDHESHDVEPPTNILSLVCSWKWKDRKCTLRLGHDHCTNYNKFKFSSPFSDGGALVAAATADDNSSNCLRQHDLDQLISVCNNDVWETIKLLHAHCSGCTCWKDHLMIPSPRTTVNTKINRKYNMCHVTKLTPNKNIRRPTYFNHDSMDDDADDEGEGYDDDEDDDDHYFSSIENKHENTKRSIHDNNANRNRKRKRNGSVNTSQPTLSRDQKRQGQYNLERQQSWDDELHSVNVTNHESDFDRPTSPYRLSPSGRRRSDYEVQRLLRIERNEHKLSELGLLLPSNPPQLDNQVKNVIKKRTRSRKKISVPLSPHRFSMSQYTSESRSYPLRQYNDSNEALTFPSKHWTISKPLQPRRVLPITRPKKVQRQNISSLSTGTTTSNGYLRSTENPLWLLPKQQPIPLTLSEDTTTSTMTTTTTIYRRPRGAAPSGYDWHPTLGLWVPSGDEISDSSRGRPHHVEEKTSVDDFASHVESNVNTDDNTNDDYSAMVDSSPEKGIAKNDTKKFESNKASAEQKVYKGFCVSTDGCLLPKKQLKLDVDKVSYRRPHGASPAGFDWDRINGVWKPNCDSDQNLGNPTGCTDLILNVETYTIGNVIIKLSKNNMSMQSRYLHKGFLSTGDGCLVPKNELKVTKGVSPDKRPSGASAVGFNGDLFHGAWKRSNIDSTLSNIFMADSEDVIAGEGNSIEIPFADEIRDCRDTKSTSLNPHRTYKGFMVAEDKCFLRKKELKVDKDGSFRHPHGRSPAGFDCDPIRGVWKPENNTQSVLIDTLDDVHLQNESIFDDTNHNVLSLRATRNGFSLRADGCLLPKKELKVSKRGEYIRPHGASPAGFNWDQVHGVWKPLNDTQSVLLDTLEDVHLQNESTSDDKNHEVASRCANYKGFSLTANGCLLPKKELKVDKDGSFRRPLGASPAGFDWDAIHGVWKPENNTQSALIETLEDVHLQNKPIFDDTKQNALSLRATRNEFSLRADGCLLPKKELKVSKRGEYIRPHGASPAGFNWDQVRGVWKPLNDTQSVLLDTLEDVHLQNISTFDDTNHNVARLRATYKGFSLTTDGCLLPKKELKVSKHGKYIRPHGASPAGFYWDQIRGVWTPNDSRLQHEKQFLHNTIKSNGFSNKKESRNKVEVITSNDSPVSDTASPELLQWKGYFVTTTGSLFPKRELKRHKDGTSFKRPHGAGPLGFSWNPICGLWEPTQRNTLTTSNLKPTSELGKIKFNVGHVTTNNISTLSDDEDSKLERFMRLGFVVTSDGCLLPKKTPQPDPKNKTLYKRPHGAAPHKFEWNPSRCVWEPTSILRVNPKQPQEVQKSVHDDALFSENKDIFDWNHVAGNSGGMVGTDNIDQNESSTLTESSSQLLQTPSPGNAATETIEHHTNVQSPNIFKYHSPYPKRKRQLLQRYTPPIG